ncbi:MAG: DNA-protecting protein DprA, partial [Oscillospiraceae bacterium]|nr:DNA-protecting protein DprA [Oscillospiraceae bacterium]
AAIANSGKTAGVLACGIDVEYPRGSKAFRKTVADSGGVVVSELMPRDSTRPAYFHERNRIMSGLSSGTLIVEAAEVSGCHITALHTISQNRDLFCIPPCDIFDPRYSGVVRYLRDGAIPVFSYIDIINEYLSDVCEKMSDYIAASEESAKPKHMEKHPTSSSSSSSAKTKEKPKSSGKKKSDKSDKSDKKQETGENSESISFKKKRIIPQSAPKADYEQLPEEQAKIVAALNPSGKTAKKLTVDEIVAKKLCDRDKVHEVLLDMELDGLIERVAGDGVQLTIDN